VSDFHDLHDRVSLLRRAFDASFAEPLAQGHSDGEQLLTVRVGDSLLAVRVQELTVVERCRALASLPDLPAGCLGLAGVRGKLVAVYELAGFTAAGRAGESRWLLVSRTDPQIGFAIDEVEHCQYVERRHVSPRDVPADEPLLAVVAIEARRMPLLSIERLVQRLHARIEAAR
jgi:chemotaxis signal transduction protein